MALVYSATKGLAAMTLAVAHSRGWLDYNEKVSKYWPEFSQNGKEKITVRQLLAYQAGLFALDEPLDRSLVADLDRLADLGCEAAIVGRALYEGRFTLEAALDRFH